MAADGKTFVDRGTLQVIDNQMDQTTGTIRMKAEFPNAEPAALARAVRQCPRAGRHLEAGRRGADRGGAARAERHVRLCGRRRQQGRGAPGHGQRSRTTPAR